MDKDLQSYWTKDHHYLFIVQLASKENNPMEKKVPSW